MSISPMPLLRLVTSEASVAIFLVFVVQIFEILELLRPVRSLVRFIGAIAYTIVLVHPFITRFVPALPAVSVGHEHLLSRRRPDGAKQVPRVRYHRQQWRSGAVHQRTRPRCSASAS